MYICHLICTDNFAGVERYVAYVAAEQTRRGHHVRVIGGRPTAMAAALEPAGVDFCAAKSVRTVARAAMAGSRPDLVHSHMTAADTAAVLTRPIIRRPIVSTLHFARRRGHSTFTNALYKGLRPFITQEIAISEFVASKSAGSPKVIVNGIPVPETEPKGFDVRRPVVIMAQRLESEKDSATGIRAWASCELAKDGWTMQVLGDGKDRAPLELLAERLGVSDSVQFAGHVDDVLERLSYASIFLATASAEPFGLSVVEAMAVALPVVATASGGHIETVGSATADTMFRPGDSAAAAVVLRRLALNPNERMGIANASRERFLAEFTIERHVDRLDALYQQLIRR